MLSLEIQSKQITQGERGHPREGGPWRPLCPVLTVKEIRQQRTCQHISFHSVIAIRNRSPPLCHLLKDQTSPFVILCKKPNYS